MVSIVIFISHSYKSHFCWTVPTVATSGSYSKLDFPSFSKIIFSYLDILDILAY